MKYIQVGQTSRITREKKLSGLCSGSSYADQGKRKAGYAAVTLKETIEAKA